MPSALATTPSASRTKSASPVSNAAVKYSARAVGVSRYAAASNRVVLSMVLLQKFSSLFYVLILSPFVTTTQQDDD
jgi:hypothetical protein